jgi:hypothetical protein
MNGFIPTTCKLLPNAKTAKRNWLCEGQSVIVTIIRQRGDRATVRTESGAVFTVSASEELL